MVEVRLFRRLFGPKIGRPLDLSWNFERQKIREIIEKESFPGIIAQPYDAHIQLDMQFGADMNISFEEPIHISDWILDSRPKKRLNFHTGQAEPGTRKTSCDVEIHCDARDIENQYSDVHLPPQVKGRVANPAEKISWCVIFQRNPSKF